MGAVISPFAGNRADKRGFQVPTNPGRLPLLLGNCLLLVLQPLLTPVLIVVCHIVIRSGFNLSFANTISNASTFWLTGKTWLTLTPLSTCSSSCRFSRRQSGHAPDHPGPENGARDFGPKKLPGREIRLYHVQMSSFGDPFSHLAELCPQEQKNK